jgi:hypothetical protein
MIPLDTNKNLGIIFLPRSGSHVLQYYISVLADYTNLHELFNAEVGVELVKNNVKNQYYIDTHVPLPPFGEEEITLKRRLQTYKEHYLTQERNSFKVRIQSYIDQYPEFSGELANLPNTQFINLQRADVLYSMISIKMCHLTDVWHNQESRTVRREVDPFTYSIDKLKLELLEYVETCKHIKKYFGDIPTIYYEQFQDRPTNILNLFSGIPKKIVGSIFNKFKGNYKDNVKNLVEVETYYEEFVNQHSECFPQYFNKLPHVIIPSRQGNQPNMQSNTISC